MTDEEIQALQDELQSRRGEVEDLKAELATRDTRITELEATVAEKDEELDLANAHIAEVERAAAEAEGKLADLNSALSQAVSSYRVLVVKSNPGVLEELITGETIEAIDESLENTKALIGRVRQELEVEIAAGKVPAGAPQRAPTDLTSLSPRGKIQYGDCLEIGD